MIRLDQIPRHSRKVLIHFPYLSPKFLPVLKRLLFFVLLLLVDVCVMAQSTVGAFAEARGGAALLSNDAWAAFNNQGALAFNEQFSAGIWYRNRFMTEGLADQAIVAVIPVGPGAFGVTGQAFGNSLFRRANAGLAYGMRISEKFGVGIRLGYQSIRIAEGYGSDAGLIVEGGFAYNMNKNLSIGVQLQNVNRDQISSEPEQRMPSVLKGGLNYKFSEKVQLASEVWKAEDQELRVRVGLEYRPLDNFFLAMGIHTGPSQMSFGFAYLVGDFRFDVSSSYHQILGFTPQIGINYSAKK